MLAILAAALLAATSQHDTVFMTDGGRVVGTVVEEGPQGVSILLLDGTVRRYSPRSVLRVEYADGSVSPAQAQPAPAAPAAAGPVVPAAPVVPAPSVPAPNVPAAPVIPAPVVPAPVVAAPSLAPPPAPVIQQYSPQPQAQSTPPAQSPTPQSCPPAAPAPAQYAPPPQYPPPQYAPPPQRAQYYPPYPPPRYVPRESPPPSAQRPRGIPPMSVMYAALGVGGLSMSGEVADGLPASRIYQPQVDLWLETGVRLSPVVALGAYLDVGIGDPAADVRAGCDALGTTCTMTTGRLGVLLRRTFDPYGRSAPWIAVGTAFEFGGATGNRMMDGSNSSEEIFTYSGWEALRLMVGVDHRANGVLGIGLYGGVAFGKYTRYEDAAGSLQLDRQPFHTTVEGGVRFTLFP